MRRRLILPALALLPWIVAAANLPRKPAELTITLPDGKPLVLSQYKGKVVAVCFVLTTCTHCQKTIGFLNKDQKEFGPRGFQVLASAIEQGASSHVAEFIKTFNVAFPMGSNDGMTAIEWMQHPPAVMPLLPLLAFIDKQGNVRAQFEGDNEKFFNDQQEQNLRDQIEALLKEGAPAKKKTATGSAPPKKQS